MLLLAIDVVPGALGVDGKAQVRHHAAHVLSEQQVTGVEIPVADAGLHNF